MPNHGNGHATRLGEQTLIDDHQMEQFTPILSENEHCDSKVSVRIVYQVEIRLTWYSLY